MKFLPRAAEGATVGFSSSRLEPTVPEDGEGNHGREGVSMERCSGSTLEAVETEFLL